STGTFNKTDLEYRTIKNLLRETIQLLKNKRWGLRNPPQSGLVQQPNRRTLSSPNPLRFVKCWHLR
ncbi:hypothetical protein M1N79_03915, partial [Dehalococcoidia bacterium]|nr:hypothetical protein [Dehalococcoidia bacterium]